MRLIESGSVAMAEISVATFVTNSKGRAEITWRTQYYIGEGRSETQGKRPATLRSLRYFFLAVCMFHRAVYGALRAATHTL